MSMCPKLKQLTRALQLHHPDYSFTECIVETPDLHSFPQWHSCDRPQRFFLDISFCVPGQRIKTTQRKEQSQEADHSQALE